MNRRLLGMLLLLLLAGSTSPASAQKNKPADALKPGASPEDARERLGPPPRISRQILLHRAIEQWHYPAPNRLRLTFEYERGLPPVLRRIDSP